MEEVAIDDVSLIRGGSSGDSDNEEHLQLLKVGSVRWWKCRTERERCRGEWKLKREAKRTERKGGAGLICTAKRQVQLDVSLPSSLGFT